MKCGNKKCIGYDTHKRGNCFNTQPVEDCSLFEQAKEPKLYYQWVLWFKNGNSRPSSIYLDDQGKSGSGVISRDWHDAIKREKLGKGYPKCEGQEGYDESR